LLPFNPPLTWDKDTSLWDFVLEQGLSGREPEQEIIAPKEETKISTDEGVMGSLILWYDCLLMPGWHTSWMEEKALTQSDESLKLLPVFTTIQQLALGWD
jgi:hypothetical protein